VSAASPATGAERDVTRDDKGRAGRRPGPELPFEVKLEHARWKHFGWAVAGLLLGGVLVWKLGIVGKGLGVTLLVAALLAARAFAMTLMNEPGTIRVSAGSVHLPRGLCRGAGVDTPIGDVKHVFFLRRAVPWMRTGPVLVVETAGQAFLFPRDWFGSESDQRRIATALNRQLGRA
jgi:hypothetical protein